MVRLTDRLDMTIAVDSDNYQNTKQTGKNEDIALAANSDWIV